MAGQLGKGTTGNGSFGHSKSRVDEGGATILLQLKKKKEKKKEVLQFCCVWHSGRRDFQLAVCQNIRLEKQVLNTEKKLPAKHSPESHIEFA